MRWHRRKLAAIRRARPVGGRGVSLEHIRVRLHGEPRSLPPWHRVLGSVSVRIHLTVAEEEELVIVPGGRD